jgi:hypothetical protein
VWEQIIWLLQLQLQLIRLLLVEVDLTMDTAEQAVVAFTAASSATFYSVAP